jgi:hypothetical protein
VIRRHVAVWATTPLLRMLALPAALLVAAGMPLAVAVLDPRAISGTWPALLGLAYLTTTMLIHPRSRRGATYTGSES